MRRSLQSSEEVRKFHATETYSNFGLTKSSIALEGYAVTEMRKSHSELTPAV